MLTLTRKVGEMIRIGDEVQIVVKEIRKNQVRIGIVAPREVKIYLEEVYQNIAAENRGTSQAGADLEIEDGPTKHAQEKKSAGSAPESSEDSGGDGGT